MRYEILDDNGNVVNTIVADEQFVEQYHPGKYRKVSDLPPQLPSFEKTEEEKLADAVAAAVTKLVADGVLKQA